MNIKDFDYDLPEELIAQHPVKPRTESRLLVVGLKLEHKKFSDIIDYLSEGDVLVVNETRVFPGKLMGKKESGSEAEIIVEHKVGNLYQTRVKSRNPHAGMKVFLDCGASADLISEDDGKFLVKFDREIDFDKYGDIPLPPYVTEELKDTEDYQTVYSKSKGSIAAPTAGLHFSKDLLKKIEDKGVKIAKVLLHVNYGTFLPIRAENVVDHKMEKEYYEVPKESADLINNAKRVVVVGTTSLRTLETVSDDSGIVWPEKGWTGIYINPSTGMKNKASMLITNFHLPRTSLLVLVSTFTGREKIMAAYQEAIREKYRFYSFGDATLLFRA